MLSSKLMWLWVALALIVRLFASCELSGDFLSNLCDADLRETGVWGSILRNTFQKISLALPLNFRGLSSGVWLDQKKKHSFMGTMDKHL